MKFKLGITVSKVMELDTDNWIKVIPGISGDGEERKMTKDEIMDDLKTIDGFEPIAQTFFDDEFNIHVSDIDGGA